MKRLFQCEILLISALICGSIIVGCANQQSTKEKNNDSLIRSQAKDDMDTTLVDEVFGLIDSCPAWSDIRADDLVTQNKILAACEKISTYKLAIIKQAINKYINSKKKADMYDVSSMSRLFILNRYIFKVPSKASFDRGAFGGWHGVPSDAKEVNWLWPLSLDVNGKIQLINKFRGYTGHEFLALQEFDYFEQQFGLRLSLK